MVTNYESGSALIRENEEYLKTNPYLSMFFFLDAAVLQTVNKSNYALMVQSGEKKLLGIRVEPYSLVLFGEEVLAGELFAFLKENGYDFSRILGAETVCGAASEFLRERFGIVMEESLAMDFMETEARTGPSSAEVELASESDVPELTQCGRWFLKDCGLTEETDEAQTLRQLKSFRILRRDGKIAAMARITPATECAKKIAFVYTRPEYRGQGLARKLVNTVKNEILDAGMTATLNVDRKNPISYHLYESLGFRKVFSQGEYRTMENA